MVIILDEKQMLPAPPPYTRSLSDAAAPPFPGTEIQRPPATFESLPSSVALYIIQTLITPASVPGGVVRTRKILYWMTMCLRLVNKSVYVGTPCYASLLSPCLLTNFCFSVNAHPEVYISSSLFVDGQAAIHVGPLSPLVTEPILHHSTPRQSCELAPA